MGELDFAVVLDEDEVVVVVVAGAVEEELGVGLGLGDGSDGSDVARLRHTRARPSEKKARLPKGRFVGIALNGMYQWRS